MPHGEIAIGVLTSLVNIAIHAVIMSFLSWAALATSRALQHKSARLHLTFVMMAAVTVLMAAHVLEVIVWALVYAALDVVPHRANVPYLADAAYFAFVNYTTLGYGDMLPVEYWRLLGPMAAMNGILLFGWSTAVIYDVLRTVAQAIPMKPSS
jgi:hypothetical protein